MPTFKLNGQEVEFEPGEMLIEAAARHGVSIPYYCYHPDLSIPANCRMCLVEMAGAPKPIPACQWPVNEKMDIQTESERVKLARNQVMEFLLINHPIDCPICDQAGECKLQQYSYLFGSPSSAMLEPKVQLDKRKVLGPNVVLDQERCISCTRCVRFLEEVTGTGELQMVHRSHHSTVDRHPERELDNEYSGCVVDMCPVGALTDRKFRFRQRVWYLQATPTTCTLCSRGCNVLVDWEGRRGAPARVERVRGRRNPAVNKSWICDEGRYGHQAAASDGRPTRARGGTEHAGGVYDVLDAVVGEVAGALRERSGRQGWLAVVASGAETNEELSALAELARAADPKAVLVVPAFEDADEDELLRRTDRSANRTGARRLGWGRDAAKVKGREVVLAIDADARPDAGALDDLVGSLPGGTHLVAMTAHRRSWADGAAALLPLANAYEKDGTIVNCGGILQRVTRCVPPLGASRPAQVHAAAIAAAADLGRIEACATGRLAASAEKGGPFAGLDPERLGAWGARLLDDGGIEYLPEPVQLFGSAPRSFAEGEYLPFKAATTAPPAVHVSAGSPTAARFYTPAAGRGVVATDAPAEASGEKED